MLIPIEQKLSLLEKYCNFLLHKNIKKSLFRGILFLLVGINLIGCNTAQVEGITTITLSGWQSSPAEKQQLEQLLKEFEATHPQIKVKYEVIADQYMDVIKTRLIGDAAPDVFYLDALEAPLLMRHGVLEPLNAYISDEFDLADFEPALLEAFQDNGNIYGIPKDFSTLALFYNQQFFKQANLSAPPQTWDELRTLAQKLTIDKNQDGRIERYGLGISPELSRQLFLIQAYGGSLVDHQGYATFATYQSIQGLEYVIDLYRKDRSAGQPSDVGASAGSEMFGQGKAAMVIEGSWAIPYLKETFPNIKFATAEIPILNNKRGTMTYTVAYVMNRKTEHKQAAWELIAYLTGKAGMKAWAKEGLALPARNSVLAELGYNQNPLYAPFVAGAKYATIWQAGENLPIIMTHFNNQFISALLGEQSLRAALLRAQEAANKEIQASDY
jgi:multiple sugar transport system substrate-binding protein